MFSQQNPDGSWTPAEPLTGSRLFRVETWLRKRGRRRLAGLLSWWDERGLG